MEANRINERIETINTFVVNNKIESLINYHPNGKIIHHSEHNTNECHDIRCILMKKTRDIFDIIRLMNCKLTYIKSGTTGHTFRAIFCDDVYNINEFTRSYAIKIVPYPRQSKDSIKRPEYGDIYDIRRPENAELLMLHILSYFVHQEQTPHIVLPIMTFNTDIHKFVEVSQKSIKDEKRYNEFIEKYKKNKFNNQMSVLISEWANGGDLHEYIKKHYNTMTKKEWRVIFFQLLSTLAIIQTKYPNFRHNDLKLNNILIHKISKKSEWFRYDINDRTYIVPNIGIQIKIWDFDFACIPGLVDNHKVNAEWTTELNIIPEQNRYYDVHYFFNTMTQKGFFPDFYENKNVDKKVKEFVRRIVPMEFATSENNKNITNKGRLKIPTEYKTPESIIMSDKFFYPLRQ